MMICHTRHDHIKAAVLKGRVVADAVQDLHTGTFLPCLFKHLFLNINAITADTAFLRKPVQDRSRSAAHFKNCHTFGKLHILCHKPIEFLRKPARIAVIIFPGFLIKSEISLFAHGKPP